MSKRHAVLAITATLVFTAGVSFAFGQSTRRITGKPLSSKPSPLDSEATNEANKAWERYLTKCGEFYFRKEKDLGIYEYSSVSIKTQQIQLDEADSLNGVQWKGTSTFTAGAIRAFFDLKREWTKWESDLPGLLELSLKLTKTQGNWTVTEYWPTFYETKPICSKIPGIENPSPENLLGSAAVAQRGGKAEPERIGFKRGASSATLTNTVRGHEEMEYVFAAREGQRVTITLTSSPARSTHFALLREDAVDFKPESNGMTWMGVAPATGDYFLNVSRVSHKAGRASFSLKLTIN